MNGLVNQYCSSDLRRAACKYGLLREVHVRVLLMLLSFKSWKFEGPRSPSWTTCCTIRCRRDGGMH